MPLIDVLEAKDIAQLEAALLGIVARLKASVAEILAETEVVIDIPIRISFKHTPKP